MEISRNWRLQQERYRLIGVVCPHCDVKDFPPRIICQNCGTKTEAVAHIGIAIGLPKKNECDNIAPR
jgi:uncharacterized OB-fold protein